MVNVISRRALINADCCVVEVSLRNAALSPEQCRSAGALNLFGEYPFDVLTFSRRDTLAPECAPHPR